MKIDIKNKIFIIILLVLITLFSFTCVSLASFDVTVDDTVYTVPDLPIPSESYTDYVLFLNKDYYYVAFLNNIDLDDLYVTGSNGVYGGISFKSGTGDMYRCKTTDSSFVFYESIHSSMAPYAGYGLTVLLQTTVDIQDISSGEVVFPQTPLPTQVVKPAEVTKVEEIPEMILEILGMMIPIFLTIFGVLLVLYLIKSKNLLHL